MSTCACKIASCQPGGQPENLPLDCQDIWLRAWLAQKWRLDSTEMMARDKNLKPVGERG
jgi:hypothetical protein